LANIISQIKRNRQNEKRRLHNRNFRGAARTAITAARSSFAENDPETKEAVMLAISTLDKAAQKGVIHPNNASRRKGRLMKRLAAFLSAPVKTEEAGAKKKK
jgi:small subunit ribosomal protein S20